MDPLLEETCFVPAFQSASDGSHSSWPPQRGKLHCSLSSCENWTVYCTPPKFLRWEPENYLFGKGEAFYKPLSSLLVIVTFHCLTFTLQGFPNIWSYLCYKKTPAWICPYFECWSFKNKIFGSNKSGDITTLCLVTGLWVYESNLHPLWARHESLKSGVPKGRMHKNAGKLK